MKRFFDEELDQLRSHLTAMGTKAITQVRKAVRALMEKNPVLAEEVRANDNDLDRLEMEVDAEVLRYMGLRAPVARDLRLVVVGMKAGHDLERVGDEANNIAKRVKRFSLQPPVKPFPDLPRMASLVEELLRDALDAFFEGNVEKSLMVCQRDKEVDALNKEIYAGLATGMAANPAIIPAALELMFVSRSLERIGDHATNIAEEVIFLLRGKDIRHAKRLTGEPPEALLRKERAETDMDSNP